MQVVKKFLMNYIKSCYVCVKFNESIKVAHLQKLANQSMANLEMVINFFSKT